VRATDGETGYKQRVSRQGPIPFFVHGLIEYVAAALFIVAPFALDFDSGAATAVSIVVGVVVLLIAATTVGPTSLVDSVPISVHIVVDFALAALLIAVPFLFGFSDETNPTAFFIGLGVVHLLLTIATRFTRAGAGDGLAHRSTPARDEDAAADVALDDS